MFESFEAVHRSHKYYTEYASQDRRDYCETSTTDEDCHQGQAADYFGRGDYQSAYYFDRELENADDAAHDEEDGEVEVQWAEILACEILR